MLGDRTPRDRRQPERPRVGAAAERRSRRRGDAAPAVARHQPQDARRRSPEHRHDAARSRADRGDARRLPAPPNRCCGRRSRCSARRSATAIRSSRRRSTACRTCCCEQRRYDEAAAALERGADDRAPPRSAPIISWSRSIRSISAPCSWRGKTPAAAEPLLREGLRVRSRAPGLVPSRRRTFVEDDWSVGATREPARRSADRSSGAIPEAETALLDARRELESLPGDGRRRDEDRDTRASSISTSPGAGRERAASFRALLQ